MTEDIEIEDTPLEIPLENLRVTNIYDQTGIMNMTVGMDFMNQALTQQSQEQGIISAHDFLEIKSFGFDGTDFKFRCDVNTYLLV